MAEECDVLVVGLGPAGAAAATAAAKTGARVVAIEQRSHALRSAHCPEFIPLALGRYAAADGLVIQEIAGLRRSSPRDGQSDTLLPGCVVDRDAFDRALVDFAAAAGADLRHSTFLTALDADASTVSLSGPQGPSHIRFRALIAADGLASAVAQLLVMAPLEKMYTTRLRVPLRVPQDTIDVWISPEFSAGYGWLMPAGPDAVIGVGMVADVAHVALDSLHHQLLASGVVGPEILGRSTGPVAVGGMRDPLVSRNVLFAGDAAGLAHPLTGAGIYSAVVSGEAAGRAAAERAAGQMRALSAYEARIRDEFGETMERALQRRKPLESLCFSQTGVGAPGAAGWSVVRGVFAH